MARDFRDVTFQKVLRGYAQKEVDDYIAYLNDEYKKMEQRVLESERRYELVRKKFDDALKNPGSGDAVGSVAKEAAARLLRKAEARWTEIIASAEEEAEAIRAEARAEAESHKDDAKRIYDTAQTLFGEINAFREKLFDLYNEHLSTVDKITETTQGFMDDIGKVYSEGTPTDTDRSTEEPQETPDASARPLTGYASIDRPWMKFYPKEVQQLRIPECTLNEYLEQRCVSKEHTAIHYYGTDISWREFFEKVAMVAKSLKALGFGEHDQIPVFLRSVPEFLMILLAAEKIGAHVVCRDNLPEENAYAVKNTGSSVVIAHDFLPQEEIDALETVGVQKFVLISAYNHANRSELPDHVEREMRRLYEGEREFAAEVIDWDAFIALGETYTGEVEAPLDIDRPLYSAYTSGSTGTSKQVIHSAHTMIGIVHQMSFYGSSGDFRPTWLQLLLPPSLIAVVNSMLLMPLASNKLLILDPFCDVYDIDLEIMRYQPNGCPLIPMFIEILVHSKRIPEDYDLSHLFASGVGCESFNNGQYKRAQAWVDAHHGQATLTAGYGLSEAGSNAIFPNPLYPQGNGNIGMPMPLNNTSIFKPGTQEELRYMEFGEICLTSPGMMIGYDNPEKTKEVLQLHPDGNYWLHTGDYGYMNEDGIIYCYGRGNTNRYGGGYLSEISMENRVSDRNVPGVLDAFFVITDDVEHPGDFVPYLYVVLEDGVKLEDVRDQLIAPLNDYEMPAEIVVLPERPFFHFKTNRIGLAKEIKRKQKKV